MNGFLNNKRQLLRFDCNECLHRFLSCMVGHKNFKNIKKSPSDRKRNLMCTQEMGTYHHAKSTQGGFSNYVQRSFILMPSLHNYSGETNILLVSTWCALSLLTPCDSRESTLIRRRPFRQ